MLRSPAVRWTARHLAAASLLLLALVTCRPQGPQPPAGPWERFDLWSEEPQVLLTPFEDASRQPYRAVVGYLGAQEVRDLDRVPPSTLAVYPHQSSGQVRTLRQAAGSQLAWRLTLGEEPYLSFTPLAEARAPCACTFRIGVRDAETATEIFQWHAEEPPPPAPPVQELDLRRWAGREVELLLHVDGPRGRWVRWASPAVYSRGAEAAPAPTEGGPNIVLIGVDTLRADHVGAYREVALPRRYGPSLTPAIDRLAAESDVWLEAFSTFNVTNPSFASILTGLYGKNHGVYDLHTPLPAAHTTLAELFHGAGYETLAVITAHHLGDHNSGLGQGFDQVVLAGEHMAAEMAVDSAVDWIGERQRPFFLWLHLFDPHTPHTPPEPYALGLRPAAPRGLAPVGSWSLFRDPGPVVHEQPVLAGHRHLYAGEVAYMDRQIDRLLGYLESRGLLETTLVALVSDHGENLGEHGILHRHIGLWETTLRVPLMIRWPGRERQGREIRGLVQTLDLFPTLLAAAGLDVPPQDGLDLATATGPGRPGRRAIFAEHASLLGVTVRTREHRYMRSLGNPHIADGAYLFDLERNPAESRNLSGTGLEVEERLAAILERWLGEKRPAPEARGRDLDEEELERLRSLGYL